MGPDEVMSVGVRRGAGAFDARSLEERYAFIDACPEALLPQIITLPIGSISARVAGVCAWRDALLSGCVPRAPWPPGPIGASAARTIDELGLARFCQDQPELVDEVLKDLVATVARQRVAFESEVLHRLRALEALERAQRDDERKERGRRRSNRRRRAVALDEATIARLMRLARGEVESRQTQIDEELRNAWAERVRLWSEVADVFGDLGRLLGPGWDLSLGLPRHTGWLELLRLRELLEQLPGIRDVVRSLGRLQQAEHGEPVCEQIFAPIRRLEEERTDIWTPEVPAETRGIERGSTIARMLPAEAAMLGHPELRLLWHARRAERALLLYHIEGVTTEAELREVDDTRAVQQQRPRPERGPIIAIVDTSGSMHGLPEQIAKALVLQALRTALEERRRCFVYAYSGPGQILEHELELTADGLGKFLVFLGMSFHGGNDEAGVLLRVVDRLRTEGWKRADVVFVSDGEWPAPTEALAGVAAAREGGTRFTGVQIGNCGQTGLHEVCDLVHAFGEWAELAGW